MNLTPTAAPFTTLSPSTLSLVSAYNRALFAMGSPVRLGVEAESVSILSGSCVVAEIAESDLHLDFGNVRDLIGWAVDMEDPKFDQERTFRSAPLEEEEDLGNVLSFYRAEMGSPREDALYH